MFILVDGLSTTNGNHQSQWVDHKDSGKSDRSGLMEQDLFLFPLYEQSKYISVVKTTVVNNYFWRLEMNEAIGELNKERPNVRKFVDAVILRFDEEFYDKSYSECREPPYTPYDIFVSGDLLDCLDKVIEGDPEKWIRRYQHILEDHDGMSEEYDTESYFKDILITGGYL